MGTLQPKRPTATDWAMGRYREVPGKAADTAGTVAAPGCTKLGWQTSEQAGEASVQGGT